MKRPIFQDMDTDTDFQNLNKSSSKQVGKIFHSKKIYQTFKYNPNVCTEKFLRVHWVTEKLKSNRNC